MKHRVCIRFEKRTSGYIMQMETGSFESVLVYSIQFDRD